MEDASSPTPHRRHRRKGRTRSMAAADPEAGLVVRPACPPVPSPGARCFLAP